VTILEAGNPKNRGSIPGRSRRCWSCPERGDWLWDPPSRPYSGYPGTLQGLMWPGHEVDNSPPSNAEVTSGAIPPLLLYAFIPWYMDNFAFSSTQIQTNVNLVFQCGKSACANCAHSDTDCTGLLMSRRSSDSKGRQTVIYRRPSPKSLCPSRRRQAYSESPATQIRSNK